MNNPCPSFRLRTRQARSAPSLDERQIESLLAVAFAQFVLGQIEVADMTQQSESCLFVSPERTATEVELERRWPFGWSVLGEQRVWRTIVMGLMVSEQASVVWVRIVQVAR